MDRSNSLPSDTLNGGSRSGSSAPFPYQTRLLERTSSRSGHALSRSNSQSSTLSLLTNTTGSSVASIASVAPRRWTSTHRVTSSLDTIRLRREDHIQDALPEQQLISRPERRDTETSSVVPSEDYNLVDHGRPISSASVSFGTETHTTTKHLKRQTMPAPIISSALLPNSTGIPVEADTPSLATPQRIRITTPESPINPASWRSHLRETSSSSPTKVTFTPSASGRVQRSQAGEVTSLSPSFPTLERSLASWKTEAGKGTSNPVLDELVPSTESIYISSNRKRTSKCSSISIEATSATTNPVSQISPAMFPTPYRSSYMASKKASSFDPLSTGGCRRRLGSHLPRIASGDVEDSSVTEQNYTEKSEERSTRKTELTKLRDRRFIIAIQEKRLTPSGVLTNNGVVGLPGRISLKAPSQDPSPSSGSRLFGGSWADKQRHLLQAYEYLCHVGEAQQWIEGCLGEELECGVVELEDTLQNGVILARLVRVFQGDIIVKRIYEVRTEVLSLLFSLEFEKLLGWKQTIRLSSF